MAYKLNNVEVMRIQFISNYSDLYGANRSLLTLIEYFHKNGFTVNVLLPSNGSMAKKLKEDGISYDIIPYYAAFLYVKPIFKHLLVPILAVLDFIVFPFIIYKIKKFNADIIYSNTSAENFGVFVAKILDIKHIAHIREFMSLDYNSFFIFGEKAKSRFVDLSDGSIYVSNAVLDSFHGLKKDKKRHTVIYNGIATTKDSLEVKIINRNKIVFGIVGILDPAKGQDIAINYFKKILEIYPGAILNIYGDKEGSYKNKIKTQVKNLNLTKSVNFCGFVNNQNDIFDSIDIMFMFSRSEGFGRVTIEAALNGVPVIGFDNAGTSELILDKKTGCLFQDNESFVESVKFLVDSDENFLNIRNMAFKNAKKIYNVDRYCESVKQFVVKIHYDQGIKDCSKT
jgi:glycosyltransferase involved in cell wall biosynthesis